MTTTNDVAYFLENKKPEEVRFLPAFLFQIAENEQLMLAFASIQVQLS